MFLTGAEMHTYSARVNLTRERRGTLRRILTEHECASQEQILHELAVRGVQTTQPVLSRDLRALRAAKRDGVYSLLENDSGVWSPDSLGWSLLYPPTVVEQNGPV